MSADGRGHSQLRVQEQRGRYGVPVRTRHPLVWELRAALLVAAGGLHLGVELLGTGEAALESGSWRSVAMSLFAAVSRNTREVSEVVTTSLRYLTVRFATKKGGGVTSNGRDSNP